MSTQKKAAIAASATPKTTSAATAVKRKAARQPPVADRAGVTLGAPTTSDVTDEVTTAPSPSAPAPTTTLTSTAPTDPTTTGTTPATTSLPASASAAANTPATAIPLMNAPPTVSIPVPPAGFVPIPGIDLRGFRPMQAELAAVPDAVFELSQFPNWALIFGITAPASTSVGQRLQVAVGWTSLLAQSNSWNSYVKSQEGMAWKDALEVMDSLKAPFQLAVTASPSMASQYPALMRLLGAQKVVAKRAASTKKKNAAAVTAAAASTTATTPAATGTTSDAGTAGAAASRTVTVTG
jgi:hypothetical protein